MAEMTATATMIERPAGVGGASLVDPAAVMRIRSMQLRARIVVEGFWHGIHRSPYHGFSVEFTEYRQYTHGDDPRFIDWRVYARSDRVFIKKFEDETNLRCHLLVDLSRSMAFKSGEHDKARYGATLAATLTHFLMSQGDAVGLTTFDGKVVEYLPMRNRPGHLRRIMGALDRAAAGRSTDIAGALNKAAGLLRKRGLVVLMSDLLSPVEDVLRSLRDLRAAGHEVVVFALQDAAEADFAFEGSARYVDLESGRELLIDADDVKRGYLERMNEHYDRIGVWCKAEGVEYHRWRTDRAFELALFEFVADRARKTGTGGRVRRAKARGRAVA